MRDTVRDGRVLEGPIVPTFVRYAATSLVGFMAISTASVVDGIFVGKFVGSDALAAVNLLLPYFTLLFGAALMLAVGGAVRAGRYLGGGDAVAAGAIFSKTVIGVFALTASSAVIGNLLDERVFRTLGVPQSLFPLLHEYFPVISAAMIVQLVALVCYYFVRVDGRPGLATGALVAGAFANIALNALFVGVLRWGLRGAAWATLIAQTLQLSILITHSFSKRPHLSFGVSQRDWGELARSALNGASEFVNEVSTGVVMFLINWLTLKRAGVEGVSAFAAVNFAIFSSLMVFYGIGDAVHVLVSQNLGSGELGRIRRIIRTALASVALVSGLFCAGLTAFGEYWLGLFVDGSGVVLEASLEFLGTVWPMFLVNGANVVLTVYLLAMHRPIPAGLLALTRSLVFPAAGLLALSSFREDVPFLLALPLGEWATFLLALLLLARFRPEREPPAAEAAERVLG